MAKRAFHFNNKTGRCETCEGAGVITLSMNVMGTINQICPSCNGKRFKPEVLQVHWNNKNIAEIYDLSIEEAFDFFNEEKQITKILSLMLQLGLGYIKLGNLLIPYLEEKRNELNLPSISPNNQKRPYCCLKNPV